MTANYSPKVGDRVRAFREGVVTAIRESAVEIDGEAIWSPAYTWEKLQDPEPEWFHGDHVAVFDDLVPEGYHYIRRSFNEKHGGEHWVDLYDNKVDDEAITRHWEAGRLKILYKGDGAS